MPEPRTETPARTENSKASPPVQGPEEGSECSCALQSSQQSHPPGTVPRFPHSSGKPRRTSRPRLQRIETFYPFPWSSLERNALFRYRGALQLSASSVSARQTAFCGRSRTYPPLSGASLRVARPSAIRTPSPPALLPDSQLQLPFFFFLHASFSTNYTPTLFSRNCSAADPSRLIDSLAGPFDAARRRGLDLNLNAIQTRGHLMSQD